MMQLAVDIRTEIEINRSRREVWPTQPCRHSGFGIALGRTCPACRLPAAVLAASVVGSSENDCVGKS